MSEIQFNFLIHILLLLTGLQKRVCIGKLFSFFLKELSQSFEHPKHMFRLMGKKNHNFKLIKCLYLDLSFIIIINIEDSK